MCCSGCQNYYEELHLRSMGTDNWKRSEYWVYKRQYGPRSSCRLYTITFQRAAGQSHAFIEHSLWARCWTKPSSLNSVCYTAVPSESSESKDISFLLLLCMKVKTDCGHRYIIRDTYRRATSIITLQLNPMQWVWAMQIF